MATKPMSKGRPRGRGRGGRAELEESGLEDSLVKLYRCATVVKGGRRFSFGALVVVGDKRGRVGFGYGKANEVPPAVEKGIKSARRGLFDVPLRGTTVPHRVVGRFGASRVVMVPASEGTGVIAGAAPRAVLELAGVKDVLTKCYGSTSPKNLVKATINGLKALRTRKMVEALRGVKLDLPPEPEPVKAAVGEDAEEKRDQTTTPEAAAAPAAAPEAPPTAPAADVSQPAEPAAPQPAEPTPQPDAAAKPEGESANDD
jgi:small subunit ribosomal protein S5